MRLPGGPRVEVEVVDADPVPEVPLLHLLPVLVVIFDP